MNVYMQDELEPEVGYFWGQHFLTNGVFQREKNPDIFVVSSTFRTMTGRVCSSRYAYAVCRHIKNPVSGDV